MLLYVIIMTYVMKKLCWNVLQKKKELQKNK